MPPRKILLLCGLPLMAAALFFLGRPSAPAPAPRDESPPPSSSADGGGEKTEPEKKAELEKEGSTDKDR